MGLFKDIKIYYLDLNVQSHGGRDPGAISKHIIEKDMNLILSKMLEKVLIERGATVYLTRDDDYDLSSPHSSLRKRNDLYKRAKLINESIADIYVSMHLNAYSDSSWSGFQIFYDDINENNKILAQVITDSVKKKIANVSNIKESNEYYMYKRIKKPGVLIELGFITNPNENYLLRQGYYQKKIINCIADGIQDYLLNY